MMTTARANMLPTVVFDQLDQITDFHRYRCPLPMADCLMASIGQRAESAWPAEWVHSRSSQRAHFEPSIFPGLNFKPGLVAADQLAAVGLQKAFFDMGC